MRRTVWGLAGLGALALAGLIAATIAAAHCQPLTFGDFEEMPVHALPGLPAGRGITGVNTFGHYREDIYVPPQRGAFSLFVTLANRGSRSVTIVSAAPPPGLQSAGTARYLASGLVSQNGREVWRVLHAYQLRPGAEVEIGMPVRTWPCAAGHDGAPVAQHRERGAGAAAGVENPPAGRPRPRQGPGSRAARNSHL